MPVTKTLRTQLYWEDFEEVCNEELIPLLQSPIMEIPESIKDSEDTFQSLSKKISFWKRWFLKLHFWKKDIG